MAISIINYFDGHGAAVAVRIGADFWKTGDI